MNVTSHPGIDQSGALADLIAPEELSPEIWRQFLDRLLLELTSTLLMAEDQLVLSQQRALLYALNQFPGTMGSYSRVARDGSLELKNGQKISWFQL